MDTFDGFAPGRTRLVKIPAAFFSDLLPLIDDLAELKVVLFCIWALLQKDGETFRCLRRADFLDSPELMRGLETAAPGSDAAATLDAALARAVERGALLCAEVRLNDTPERLYFVNTARGRTALAQITAGAWQPREDNTIEILPERPNIFRLYEDNIGAITGIIADALKAAEMDYPPAWIEEAFREAVECNKRSWRYIETILKRWEREGKSREVPERSDEPDGRRYVSGKYAGFIEH